MIVRRTRRAPRSPRPPPPRPLEPLCRPQRRRPGEDMNGQDWGRVSTCVCSRVLSNTKQRSCAPPPPTKDLTHASPEPHGSTPAQQYRASRSDVAARACECDERRARQWRNHAVPEARGDGGRARRGVRPDRSAPKAKWRPTELGRERALVRGTRGESVAVVATMGCRVTYVIEITSDVQAESEHDVGGAEFASQDERAILAG